LRELLQAEETKKWHAPGACQHRPRRSGKQGFFTQKARQPDPWRKKEVKTGHGTLFFSSRSKINPFFVKKRANLKTPLAKKRSLV